MTAKDSLNRDTLRQALAHVLWICGAPDAGKTSVATRLTEKYGLQCYSCDDHAEEHWLNHISQDPTAFGHAWLAMSVDERWLQPPDIQGQNVSRIVADDFPYVINDLLKMPTERLIVVEGNLSPDLVAPLLTTKNQAIWLTPTDSFYQDSFFRRGKHLGHTDTSNPQLTRDNHMARDRLSREQLKEAVLIRGLEMLEIDGFRSVSDVAETIENHFESFLTSYRFR